MTTEQLAAFTKDFRKLLDKHGTTPAEALPGSRPIELRFFALPATPGRTPDDEHERPERD